MSKLYIVRHGRTDWNDLGLIQGRTDTELNSEGIKSVNELKNIIDLSDIDICLSSPLKRAKDTAIGIVDGRIPIMYDNLLVERSFGKYEGVKIDFEVVKMLNDYKLDINADDIESMTECIKRANTFLDKVKKEYPDKNILIVSHGAFIKLLHFVITGYDENTDFLSFHPLNTKVYEYEI